MTEIPKNIVKLCKFIRYNPGLHGDELKAKKCPQLRQLRNAEQSGFIEYSHGWFVTSLTMERMGF